MSDKTKRIRDDAEIAKRFAAQRAKDAANPPIDPRCSCGRPAAIAVHWGRGAVFYCDACEPDVRI